MEWINENKEWIFSGIGAVVIGVVIRAILERKKSKRLTQNQKSGRNSTNIQAGGDIKL